MKQAFQFLARFILTLLMLTVVLGALVVLFRYVIGYDPVQASATAILVRMLDAMRDVVVIALIMSAVSALFSVLRRVDNPFVPLVVLLFAWSAAFVLVTVFWPASATGHDRPVAHVPENRVIQVSGAHVYTPETTGLTLAPVAIQRSEETPGITLFAEAVVDPDLRAILVPGRPGISLSLDDVSASYPAMVSTPQRVAPLLRDIRSLNELVFADDSSNTEDTRHSLLVVVALSVFLVACLTPARLTRWPMFNALLVFGLVRAALWLLHSIHFGELGGLLLSAVGSGQLVWVSAGVLLFVSVVLLVALFLMPPLSEWKREVSSD